MSKEIAKNEVDDRTRRYIERLVTRKSAREISTELNVPVDVVLRVKQEMADSFDTITVRERVIHSINTLSDITTKAIDEFERTNDLKSKAPLLSSATNALKAQMQVLEKWVKSTDPKVEALNRKRQEELTTLLTDAFTMFAQRVSKLHDIPEQELWDQFEDDMREAARLMDERNIDD